VALASGDATMRETFGIVPRLSIAFGFPVSYPEKGMRFYRLYYYITASGRADYLYKLAARIDVVCGGCCDL